MEDNRYKISGSVIDIGETKQLTPFLRKRVLKLRFSDVDFTGKFVERKIKIEFLLDNCKLLDDVRLDDTVQIKFYLEGRDYLKEETLYNFTSIIGYDLIIISSPSRVTSEDKNLIIGKEGLEYKEPIKVATIDELINADPEGKFMVNPDKDVKIPEGNKSAKFVEGDIKPDFSDLPF